MSLFGTQIRLHRRATEDAQRQVAELERQEEALRLERQRLEDALARESAAAMESFTAGLTFGAFATDLKRRQDAIDRALRELADRRSQARDQLADAFADQKKYELAEDAARERALRKAASVEQARLDEIGLTIHRRQSAAA